MVKNSIHCIIKSVSETLGDVDLLSFFAIFAIFLIFFLASLLMSERKLFVLKVKLRIVQSSCNKIS